MSGEQQNTINPEHIRPGMEVVAADGTVVGTVKAVRADDLLLDLPLRADRSVPLSAVLMVNDRVILSISADAVGERSKPAPPGP